MTPARSLWPGLRAVLCSEAALALAVAVCALGVYVRTLYPGLVATGDSPKFQFVGRILGTAHNPGYPLYCVLSHVFGYLPLGTPAHRMNLLSALCGAAAVGFVTLAARRLGATRVIAAATAWSFAFGPVFWSQCTLAEVYALAAALLAAIIWTLLTWAAVGRARWLRAAVVLAALSLGHHLTIVTVLPALVLFVLLTRPREGLRPRFVVFVAIAVLLGLAQYSYVVLRTYQGAAYLGSSAHDLPELLDVVRGRQFTSRLFAFDAAEVLRERVPLVAGIVGRELGVAGAGLALVGALVLCRARRTVLALLIASVAGLVAFALNYGVPDIAVFLIPSFVPLWLLAGLGLETLRGLAQRALPGRLVAGLTVLALALPAYQLGRSLAANDHSDRTFEIRYFDALFASLPARVAFVNETHSVDHMLLYKIHAEGGETGREIYPTPARAADVERRLAQGAVVFAFEQGHRALKHAGFEFERVRLPDQPVVDYLKAQPRGRLVAVATGGREGLTARAWLLSALGLNPVTRPGALAALLPSGAFDQGRVSLGDGEAEAMLPAGHTLAGVRVAHDVRAVSDAQAAWIALGDKESVRVENGLALCVIDAAGNVVDRQVVTAHDGWRASFPERALPLWRVVGRRAGATSG